MTNPARTVSPAAGASPFRAPEAGPAPFGAVPAGARRLLLRAALALLVLLGAGLLGAGCAALPVGAGGAGGERADGRADGPGDPWLAADSVPERVRDLPKSARGNMAEYTVFGTRYRTLDSAAGFEERGVASWYGSKFHGRDTSSGEPFDMHAMTAAHRHLPLPTFVRVTRVDDGRSVVVKVNDRGPFADERIVDLSYAAAARLGMLESGTAEVTLEALSTHPPEGAPDAVPDIAPDGPSPAEASGGPLAGVATGPRDDSGEDSGEGGAGPDGAEAPADIIQLGAFADDVRAAELARRAGAHLGEVPRVERDATRALWRVRIGPLADAAAMDAALAGLAAAGIDDYALVRVLPR